MVGSSCGFDGSLGSSKVWVEVIGSEKELTSIGKKGYEIGVQRSEENFEKEICLHRK